MQSQPLEPSQVTAFVLFDLLLILIVARLVGGLARRARQPRVVGEIVAGVLLGPTLLGATLWRGFSAPSWLHCDRALAAAPTGTLPSPTECLFPVQARGVLGAVGQIALLLFMFLVGAEFDLRSLAGRVRGILVVGVGVVALPVALGFVLAPVMNTPTFRAEGASTLGFTLFLGAMMAVTAFPVMARILQEKGLTTSAMGSVGIAAAAVVTLLMFLLVAAASSIAGGGSAAGLVLKLALTAAYLAVMFGLVRPALAPLGRRFEEQGMTPGIFAALLAVLFASGAVAHQLGVNVIVGGFVAGLVLPARPALFQALTERLGELTATVLLPVFLAFSGLTTDFTKLSAAAAGGIVLFLLAGVVSKWPGGALCARAGGLSWAEGNVLGILMNCRGLLVLVVALVGVQSGVITPVMQLGGVLMALVTTAMTGPLFDRFIASATTPAATQPPTAPESVVPTG